MATKKEKPPLPNRDMTIPLLLRAKGFDVRVRQWQEGEREALIKRLDEKHKGDPNWPR